jgi:Uma2 family endonuclease
MNDWIANGAALAWLIDPYQRQVTVYAPGQDPQTHSDELISGSGPVEGFTLNLAKVWRFYET